jgi:hypothetical protein
MIAEQAQVTRRDVSTEAEYQLWRHWPVNWSAVAVGALAALAISVLFGLAAIALGAHQLVPEERIVDMPVNPILWHFLFWLFFPVWASALTREAGTAASRSRRLVIRPFHSRVRRISQPRLPTSSARRSMLSGQNIGAVSQRGMQIHLAQ